MQLLRTISAEDVDDARCIAEVEFRASPTFLVEISAVKDLTSIRCSSSLQLLSFTIAKNDA